MTVPMQPQPTEAVSVLSRPPASMPDVSKGSIAAFLFAYMGAFLILIVPVASTLALKVAEVTPETRESTLGLIAGVGAFMALLANPIFGALSDSTTSRFGTRRPWILGGAILGFAALMVLAVAQDILLVGIMWAAVQLAMNAVLAGLAAFLPDRVPEHQRGKVSALAGIAQQISPFLGLLVANVALAFGGGTVGMFVAPSVIGLALIAVYVVTARDRVLSPNLRKPVRWSTIFRAFAFNPRKNPDFGWAWFGRFFITLAFATGSTYQVYFLNGRLGVPLEQAAAYQLGLVLLGAVLLSLTASISGHLSDKYIRRKIFVFLASGLIALGSLLTAFSFDLPLYIAAAAVSGLATGMYFAVDLALVTDVLPDKEGAAAKDMGVFNIANALPQSLAPAAAPLFLAMGGGGNNYTALFIAAAVAALIGALTVIPIKKVR